MIPSVRGKRCDQSDVDGIGTVVTGRRAAALRRLNEPIRGKHAMQLFRDRAAVRLFLSEHNHETITVEQDTEVVLCDELPGRTSDVQAVLCFPVWIPVRSDDDLGEPVDDSIMPIQTVADLGSVWNTYPSRCRL